MLSPPRRCCSGAQSRAGLSLNLQKMSPGVPVGTGTLHPGPWASSVLSFWGAASWGDSQMLPAPELPTMGDAALRYQTLREAGAGDRRTDDHIPAPQASSCTLAVSFLRASGLTPASPLALHSRLGLPRGRRGEPHGRQPANHTHQHSMAMGTPKPHFRGCAHKGARLGGDSFVYHSTRGWQGAALGAAAVHGDGERDDGAAASRLSWSTQLVGGWVGG